MFLPMKEKSLSEIIFPDWKTISSFFQLDGQFQNGCKEPDPRRVSPKDCHLSYNPVVKAFHKKTVLMCTYQSIWFYSWTHLLFAVGIYF